MLPKRKRGEKFSRISIRVRNNFRVALLALLGGLLNVAAIWEVYQWHSQPKIGIDDANIFFVYAENVLGGHGIVFNAGGQRVEGFSSPLWVLISGLAFLSEQEERAVLWMSICLFLATQLLYFHLLLRLRENGKIEQDQPRILVILMFLVFLLSSPAYITWMTITLMDTVLWGAVVAWASYVILRPRWLVQHPKVVYLLIVIMLLTRSEAILFVPVFLILSSAHLHQKNIPGALKRLLKWSLFFALALGALTIFRLLYFGHPLPNTFYAKVSPSLSYNLYQGLKYLRDYVTCNLVAGISILATMVVVGRKIGSFILQALKSRRIVATELLPTDRFEFVSLEATALLMLPVITGGDHFNMSRFFQPVYPLLCINLSLLIDQWFVRGVLSRVPLLSNRSLLPTAFCAIILLYALLFSHEITWLSIFKEKVTSPLQVEFIIATNGFKQGTEYSEYFFDLPKYPSVGVISVGGFSRAYQGEVVDLLGLNNTEMAHSGNLLIGIKNHAAFDVRIFLSLLPDLVIAHPPARTGPSQFSSIVLKDLFTNPGFQKEYVFGKLFPVHFPGEYEELFIRRAYLEQLIITNDYVFSPNDSWIQP